MTDPAESHTATLVLHRAVSKLDALAMVALVLDRPVEHPGTSSANVPLGGQVRARVEIPKFGDPPPLAIDVVSTLSRDHARLEALRLAAELQRRAGWIAVPDFPR